MNPWQNTQPCVHWHAPSGSGQSGVGRRTQNSPIGSGAQVFAPDSGAPLDCRTMLGGHDSILEPVVDVPGLDISPD